MKLFAAIIVSVAMLTVQAISAAAELLPYEEQWETPALNLPDLAGRQHNIDTYRGQVVLVNFWASWCPPCVLEMPDMQRLATAFKGRPFNLLAVNFKESRTTVWRFTKMLKVDFTTLLDSTGVTSKAWDVQIYPTSYLIDADGRIQYVAYGSVDWDSEAIIQLIEALMLDRKTPNNQHRTKSDRSISACDT